MQFQKIQVKTLSILFFIRWRCVKIVIVSLEDYLNPVSKEEIVRESGLRSARNENGSDFYVTEIDPLELGVNMNVNGDEEILFGDDFNLNYFSIAPSNNIMA